jgi:hypothetical protein
MNMLFVILEMYLFAAIVSAWLGIWKNPGERLRKLAGRGISAHAILACLLVPCIASTAGAQEVVHALTGTLTAANPNGDTFSIKTADGSIASFKASDTKGTAVTFSKDVAAETVPPNAFHTLGAHVLVFYYGYDTMRTAVAIKSLGTDPLTRVTGTVRNFDKHRHAMTVDGSPAAPVDIILSGDTIVDTPDGVVEGLKYHPNKGELVRAVTKPSEGAQTALFISATGPNASMI